MQVNARNTDPLSSHVADIENRPVRCQKIINVLRAMDELNIFIWATSREISEQGGIE